MTRKEIIVEEDGLTIKTKGIHQDLEYKVKFEELGFDLFKKRVKTANIPFYFFLLFDILYLALLINSVATHEEIGKQLFWVGALLMFSAITVAAYYNRNKDVIYLSGGQKAIELFATKPDRETVNTFIDTVHNSMRGYYKSKFTVFDPTLPNEIRVNQLRWLKEIKAITDDEYADLIDKNRTDNIIGF